MTAEIATAADCVQELRRIYRGDARDLGGATSLARPRVIHVASVWNAPSDELIVLRVGEHVPVDPQDQLVLAVARARADAIVTTGKILRAEPALRHALDPSGPLRGVGRWRREVLGKCEPPWSTVLTARADLDLGHPLFAAGGRVFVTTSLAVGGELAARVRARRAGAEIQVVPRTQPGLRDTVRWLLGRDDVTTVVVEAGPSSVASLYEPPMLIDELMLSVYSGRDLAAAARGDAFLTRQQLAALFGPAAARGEAPTGGPLWTFWRLHRLPIERRGPGERITSRS